MHPDLNRGISTLSVHTYKNACKKLTRHQEFERVYRFRWAARLRLQSRSEPFLPRPGRFSSGIGELAMPSGAFRKLALPYQRVTDDGLRIVKMRLPFKRVAGAVAGVPCAGFTADTSSSGHDLSHRA